MGSNEALLRRVASIHGRTLFALAESGLRCRRPLHSVTMSLWPGLLGLAIALNLAELIIRKWRGIMDTLPPRVLRCVARLMTV